MNDITLDQILDFLSSADLEVIKLGATFAKEYSYEDCSNIAIKNIKRLSDKILELNSWNLNLLHNLSLIRFEILNIIINKSKTLL